MPLRGFSNQRHKNAKASCTALLLSQFIPWLADHSLLFKAKLTIKPNFVERSLGTTQKPG